MTTDLVALCAWCLKERTLTVLDGTPAARALIALEADEVTHGICETHAEQALDAYYRYKERSDAREQAGQV